MNLLVLGPYGETTSGPSRAVTEIVNKLSDDVNVLVLSPKKRRERTRVDRDLSNVKVRFQPCGQIPGVSGSHQWVELFRIRRRLNRLDFQPDLVWIHSATLFSAYRFSKFRSVPSISTVHGVYGGFYRSEVRQKSSRIMTDFFSAQNMLLQKFEFNNTTLVTTYSDYLKGLIKDISPNSSVAVIPNGVNTKRFQASTVPRKKAIIYVGRMAKIKGVHVLVESMKEIVNDHPDWSLWLVGSAFDQPKSFFESFMTSETSGRIKFFGRVPNEELSRILDEAGIFVMPTLRDGFEIAMMEAMASGIPCVTTAAFERTELYGNYAETVPVNSPKSLAKKLNFMIQNYSEFVSSAARQKRVNRAHEFDWTIIAERYETLFEEIVK